MIDRIRRWWQEQQRQQGSVPAKDNAVDTNKGDRKPTDEYKNTSPELTETRALLTESRVKMTQADERIQDYQRRIQNEYERRAALARGDRER